MLLKLPTLFSCLKFYERLWILQFLYILLSSYSDVSSAMFQHNKFKGKRFIIIKITRYLVLTRIYKELKQNFRWIILLLLIL